MIEPGLGRITRLLANAPPRPWKAIHVAGTNGKGSVCAYISALLRASGVSSGQFSTPHLMDRWDSITLNGRPIEKHLFDTIDSRLTSKNECEKIRATEFELLTASAFDAFTQQKVDVGVVEVGLGGRLDATNVLEGPLATLITKIGMDHESWLGDSFEGIALEKAGIMKPGAPCFIDATNPARLHELFQQHAASVKAGPVKFVDPNATEYREAIWRWLPRVTYREHQQVHIALAYEAAKLAWDALGVKAEPARVMPEIRNIVWPGRLQRLSMERLTGRREDVLLDGAHNPQSAAVLGSYVDAKLRQHDRPVTWVLACSRGKNLRAMLGCMLRPGDHVFTTSFAGPDAMPWVEAEAPNQLLAEARAVTGLGYAGAHLGQPAGKGVQEALDMATQMSNGGPLVIGGSLYLVSEVLRLLRNA